MDGFSYFSHFIEYIRKLLLALTNNERGGKDLDYSRYIRYNIIKIFGHFVEIYNSTIFNCVYNMNKFITFHEILNIKIRWM